MQRAIDETTRRRKLQAEYNKKNNITPETINSTIKDILSSVYEADYYTVPAVAEKKADYIPPREIPDLIKALRKEMKGAAKKMDFEKAAELRDRIKELEALEVRIG